jgi:hypothetical protein
MPITFNATSGITFNDGSTQNTRPAVGFRNRIINGDMRIAQRGTSTSLVAGSSNGLSADRFWGFNIGAGACSIIQASTVPSSAFGFTNSLQIDVTTADASIGSADLYMVRQTIEGLNIADLAWGTANAKTLTLSFWVRSSKTGTHFVAFKNYDQNRCYAASYAVSSADTWEQKTITVSGDTTGTWLTNNSGGIQVVWCLAVGSNFQTATANAWASGDGYATSAQVNVMDSTANDFYITGVQLEVGSTATEFERRPIGTELALCQRYFWKSFDQSVAPEQNVATGGNLQSFGPATNVSFTAFQQLPSTMRAVPSVTSYSPDNASSNWTDQGGARPTASVQNIGQNGFGVRGTGSVLAGGSYAINLIASAEL